MAVLGAAAAWFTCDIVHLDIVRCYGGYCGYAGHGGARARAAAVIIAFAVGALCGIALDSKRARGSLLSRSLIVLLVLPIAGGVVGATTALIEGWRGLIETSVSNGIAGGLAVIPVAEVVVMTAHRADRSRAGSLVSHIDKMLPWAITATAITLAGTASCIALDLQRETGGPSFAAPLTVVFGSIGVMATVMILVASCSALREVSKLARDAVVGVHDLVVDDAKVERVDLGIGLQELGRATEAGTPYRHSRTVLKVIYGDPAASNEAIRSSVLVVALLSALSLAALFLYVALPF